MRLGFITLFAANVGIFAQAPGTPPAVPQSIPAPEIAFRSEELILSLTNMSKGLMQDKALADMQASLNDHYRSLQDDAIETRKLLAADPTSIDLRVQERRWRRLAFAEKASAARLTQLANAAIGGIRSLDAEEAKWNITLDSTSRDLQSKPLRQIVARTIDKIRAVRRRAQEQVSRIVSLQARAAGPLMLIPQVQDEITKAGQAYKSRLLVQDTEPVWRKAADSETDTKTTLRRAVGRNVQMIGEFARARGAVVLIVAISFLLVLIFLYRVRSRRRLSQPGSTTQSDSVVIERPLAVAFILQLPFVPALLPDAPPSVIALLILISVIPILRILLHHAPGARRPAWLALGFYVAGAILDFMPAGSPLRRAAFVALLGVAAGVLAWMMRTRALRGPHVFGQATRTVRIAILLVIVGTLTAMIASLFGYLTLAQFLRQAILLSSYLALLLVAWTRVTMLLFKAALHSAIISSAALRNSGVELWVGRALRISGFIVWLVANLNLLLLATPAKRLMTDALQTGLPGRLSGVTLGDLLACAMVLVIGWLVARAVRFVLRHTVLSRIRLERGISDLISNLVYYVLLLMVFMASVKAMGVDLSKFTLLTGAFGVGIGFGMQNVLNNFFSGLILQFERPIQTGDVIEVAGQIGEVRRIGIRSTAIRTPQGSELIVPNASLVSNNVVNWTLTRSGCQISLPFLVRTEIAAENVIHLLVEAAEANPSVLRDPQPAAYLKNSGANGALFEVSFSVDPSASIERVRGHVANAAFRALSSANAVPCQMAH